MEIIYKLGEFPDPGDTDLFKGIQELNKDNYKKALTYFEKGATYDNEYAALFTAIVYFSGFNSSKRNTAKAMSLFKKIASKWKNMVAQYFIGLMYFEGDEAIPKDKKLGFEWGLLAAENGWSYSVRSVGHSYTYGRGVEEDGQKALEWLQKVVKKDENELEEIDDGTLYLFGNKSFELNYSKVDKETLSFALDVTRDGYISTEDYLNEQTNASPNGPKIQRILLWDILTDKKSSAVAECQFIICCLYHKGRDNISQDSGEALSWAKKAAKNGNGSACRYIALRYEDGDTGVAQDYKEAMKWYKKAHDIGRQSDPTFRLGRLYYYGNGTEQDFKKALHYFEIAALKVEHKYAFLLMGNIYEQGKGNITQDFKAALLFYRKAYELGLPSGATGVGIVYGKSSNLNQHKKLACHWIEKGAFSGCTTAPIILGFIENFGFEEAMTTVSELKSTGNEGMFLL